MGDRGVFVRCFNELMRTKSIKLGRETLGNKSAGIVSINKNMCSERVKRKEGDKRQKGLKEGL